MVKNGNAYVHVVTCIVHKYYIATVRIHVCIGIDFRVDTYTHHPTIHTCRHATWNCYAWHTCCTNVYAAFLITPLLPQFISEIWTPLSWNSNPSTPNFLLQRLGPKLSPGKGGVIHRHRSSRMPRGCSRVPLRRRSASQLSSFLGADAWQSSMGHGEQQW